MLASGSGTELLTMQLESKLLKHIGIPAPLSDEEFVNNQYIAWYGNHPIIIIKQFLASYKFLLL